MATIQNMPQAPTLLKLFASDALVDSHLQKIRDRIYSFAWSRDRRDKGKLDWIVSETGVDRNVPQRWIEETPSGSTPRSTDGLPCWMLLVNKQISTDFIRFIYSTNDLEIAVDLKAHYTARNEAKLDKIVTLLRNPNFQKHTKSARIRIHFPDNYPVLNLPAFNQNALEKIAASVDEFHNLSRFSVRIVPMQGPEIYELCLATFPFYPLSMTSWTIRMLNCRTFSWDIVEGEHVHQLNMAWDLFQRTGSLTATVDTADECKNMTICINTIPAVKDVSHVSCNQTIGQKKNGSRKRKNRKLKALSIAKSTSVNGATSTMLHDDVSLPSGSPLPTPLKCVHSVSASENDLVHSTGDYLIESVCARKSPQLAREMNDYVTSTQTADCVPLPPSPPPSPTNPERKSDVVEKPVFDISDGAVSSQGELSLPLVVELSLAVKPTKSELEEPVDPDKPQMHCPPSPAASSVTLGGNDSEVVAGTRIASEKTLYGSTSRSGGAEGHSEKPEQKMLKTKIRRKPNKSQVTNAADTLSYYNGSQPMPAEATDKGEIVLDNSTGEQQVQLLVDELHEICLAGKRPFPLAELVEVEPWNGQDNILTYRRANGRRGLISRSSSLDRFIRQKERINAGRIERQMERMKTKGNRQTKKVKQVMIRRKEPSNDLRRGAEDTNQQTAGKPMSDLSRFSGDLAQKHVKHSPTPCRRSREELDPGDVDLSSLEDANFSPYQDSYPHRRDFGRRKALDLNVTYQRSPPSRSELIAGFDDPINNAEDFGDLQTKHQGYQPRADTGLGFLSIHYPDTAAPSNSHWTSHKAHAHNQRLMTVSAIHSESKNVIFVHQNDHKDRQIEEPCLIEELDDSDEAKSVTAQYGEGRRASFSQYEYDGTTR